LDRAYGTVPLEQFDEMRVSLEAKRANLANESNERRTFREDYEFYGVSEGSVTASYRGGCKVCDLSLSFEHTEPLPLDEPS
jgi:hypothetical protein